MDENPFFDFIDSSQNKRPVYQQLGQEIRFILKSVKDDSIMEPSIIIDEKNADAHNVNKFV